MRVELHPVFSLHLYLHQFHNVDLPSRGYYQIRLSVKPSSDFSAEFALDKRHGGSDADDPFPPSVVDGSAVSRTVEVVFTDETLNLDSAFTASLQLNRTDCNGDPINLEMDVDLLFMERDRPPKYSQFTLLSRRTLQLSLNFSRPFIAYRSLFYETAAVSIASFASLVSVLPRRRKSPPDPPLSPKLKRHHAGMCSALLSSLAALQSFIQKHANLLNSPLQIEVTDTTAEANTLASTLESSQSPYTAVEVDAVTLSRRLSDLFDQFLQLFSRNEKLFDYLFDEFIIARRRSLSEGFFYSERDAWWNPILDASIPTPFDDLDEDPGPPPVLFEQQVPRRSSWYEKIRKSNLMSLFPRFPLHCDQTDGDDRGTAVIFEERYHPTVSPRSPVESANGDLAKKAIVRAAAGAGTQSGNSPTTSNEAVSEETNAFSGDTEVATIIGKDALAEYVAFVKEREHLKTRLAEAGFDGCLYSEAQKRLEHHQRPFLEKATNGSKASTTPKTPHLIVFVHGLEGSWEDLLSYRTQLQMTLPKSNLQFLMSRANQLSTWTDLYQLGANLLREIDEYIEAATYRPTRISFVAHSMGGVIVRTALGRPEAASIRPLLYTFLTLNSPHAGLVFNQRTATWGLAVVQWWKQSKSLDQLSLKDAPKARNTFIFRLSRNGALGAFKYVLLVGTHGDLFVPLHSAILEPSRSSLRDSSAMGSIYSEILHNMHADMARSAKGTTIVKYTVYPHHSVFSSKTYKFTGKAAHTSVVDDETFIEKFVSVAAHRYFE